jgi:hypothetical protein
MTTSSLRRVPLAFAARSSRVSPWAGPPAQVAADRRVRGLRRVRSVSQAAGGAVRGHIEGSSSWNIRVTSVETATESCPAVKGARERRAERAD